MSEEKKKFSFLSSVENFWYYHKWSTIGVLALVIIIIIAFKSFSVPDIPCDAKIISVFSRIETTGEISLENKLSSFVDDIDGDGEKVVARKPFYVTSSGESNEDSIYLEQIEGTMAYAGADVVMMDDINYNRFKAKDFLCDLSEFVDLSSFDKDSIVYFNETPVAIKLKGSKFLSDMEFTFEDVYIGLMFIPDGKEDEMILGRKNGAKIITSLYKK